MLASSTRGHQFILAYTGRDVHRNKEEVEDMLSMERDVGENEYYG